MILVFDLDGTIVNSSADVLVSMAFAFMSTGLVPTRELDSSLIGPPLREIVREVANDASDDDVERAVAAFRRHYDESDYSGTELYTGVKELLQAAGRRGATSLIATNKPRRATLAILDRLGVQAAFADIVCIDDSSAKDKIDVVGELLRRHGSVTDEGWMIGDAPSDIQAGKAHRLKTVAHLGGYSAPHLLHAENPDFAVEQMDELLPLLFSAPARDHD
jgi:phosphoglycolate phosphatase